MVKLTIELPEEAFSALRESPDRFAAEMRFATAVQWYHEGRISGSTTVRNTVRSSAPMVAAASTRERSIEAKPSDRATSGNVTKKMACEITAVQGWP